MVYVSLASKPGQERDDERFNRDSKRLPLQHHYEHDHALSQSRTRVRPRNRATPRRSIPCIKRRLLHGRVLSSSATDLISGDTVASNTVQLYLYNVSSRQPDAGHAHDATTATDGSDATNPFIQQVSVSGSNFSAVNTIGYYAGLASASFPGGGQGLPSLSSNGQYVAFITNASDLGYTIPTASIDGSAPDRGVPVRHPRPAPSPSSATRTRPLTTARPRPRATPTPVPSPLALTAPRSPSPRRSPT